jgi:RNA polymerase sigma factor (sigma-70 family)
MKEVHENPAGAESLSREEGGRVLRALPEDEMHDLYEKLRADTRRRYRRSPYKDDLVPEAILAVLENRRTWNLNLSPFHNLRGIIRSIASNEWKREKRSVSLDSSASHFLTDSNPAFASVPAQVSPASQFEASERLRNFRKAMAAEADRSARQIVETALDNNGWRPREIAAELKISVSEIYKAKRRILRRLIRFWNM